MTAEATDPAGALRQALALHQAGRLEAAEAGYRDLLAAHPELPDALHLLGLVMHQTGRHEEGLALLRRAVTQRPANATYQFNCGVVLSALGRHAAAADHYRQAVQLRPGEPSYRNNLGLALGADGRLEEAETAFAEALALQPGFAEAAINLADLLSRRGLRARLPEAEALVRGVLAGHPQLAKAHAVLAQTLPPGERRDEAFAALSRACALEPDNALFQLQLADLCRSTGRHQDSAVAARRAVALAPDNPDGHALLGAALLAAGQPAEALAAFEQALDADPQGLSPHDALVGADSYVALLAAGRPREAARLVDLEQLVSPRPIDVPGGFPDLAAFNDAMEAALLAQPSLAWEPTGYVVRAGSLTDNLLPPVAPIFADMEQAIRRGIARYVAGLAPDPAHPFRRALERRFRMVMWGVVLDEGGEVRTHIHEGSFISGAYYVRIPAFRRGSGHAHDGAIEFGRPDAHYGVDGYPTRIVEPAEGLLVLFPGSMFHRTIPFKADGHRITISFNCYPYAAG